MNTNKTKERVILEKLIEAKKLEGEALFLLLPEQTRRYMETLAEDMKGMLIDLAMEAWLKRSDGKSGVNETLATQEYGVPDRDVTSEKLSHTKAQTKQHGSRIKTIEIES